MGFQILTEYFNISFKIRDNTAKNFYGCTLSSPVGADITDNLTGINIQVNTFQDFVVGFSVMKVSQL